MLSAALLLFANTLLFSLRLSGGGSFPKPLSAAEEREWLQRYAQGDPEARNVLVERNLRLVAHIIKKIYHKGQMGRGKNGLKSAAPVANRSPDKYASDCFPHRRPHGPRWC